MGAQPSKKSRQWDPNNNHKPEQGEFLPLDSQPDDWPWVWAIRDPDLLGVATHTCETEGRLPVKITDQLYLGNARSVDELRQLEDLKITAVLNTAGPMALRSKTVQWFRQKGIAYKRVDGVDDSGYPMLSNHWMESLGFLRRELEENPNGRCVVHCVAGLNRSSLIATAYYMVTERVPVLEAVKHVRQQRGNRALQTMGFQEQLVAFARLHGLLGEKPGTPGSIVPQTPSPPQEFPYRETTPREHPLDKLVR